MIINLEKKYNDFVSNSFISYDSRQVEIIKEISKIWNQRKKINFFFKKEKIIGIYLYGPVGTGKTFLLNLFIQQFNKAKKIHFNHFMINLHAFMNNNMKGKEVALENFIKEIANKNNIFFIDELHIFNIVDALLVKKIFILFKKYNMFVIVSSNFHPNKLYKDGLQRSDFVPFIHFIEKKFKIIHLNQTTDYRRLMLNQSKTYFTPINEKTILEFNKLFERFVDQNQIHIKKIKVDSRTIRFEKCTANIVYCDFQELCKENLSHADYKKIADTFNLFFINNVPEFNNTNSDQCRRFISLIDMLYEKKRSVVLMASLPINQLCKVNNLIDEFKRTGSRLYEMTIIDYDKK